METIKTIESVVKEGLCTGCGTCLALCPMEAIDIVIDWRRGVYVPKLDKEKCSECGICFDICPGHAVDFEQLNSEIFGKQPGDIFLGNYLNCYTGHATDYDIRYNSASGGLVTALLIFALEQGRIDGALVTRMKKDKPLEPEPFIARTREEIISAAKSKYCPVPANIALKEILNAKEGERFAVVGLPCHIHGIRKAEQVDKRLKGKIAFHVGVLCSYTDSFKGTEFVLRKYGVNKEDVAQLAYRGAGWPGNMNIIYKNGDRKVIPFEEYIPLLHGGFFTLSRCALCCDQSAELADVSCGDAWLPEIRKKDKTGTSIILSRTDASKCLLEQAVSKNIVTLTGIEGEEIRSGSQKGAHYKARSRVAHLMGKKTPLYKTKEAQTNTRIYLVTLDFFVRKPLSMRYLQWLIVPYLMLDKLKGKVINLVRRSGSPLFR